MTRENMPSRLYIPQPFASGDGSVVADLTPIDTISGDKVNFVDGFPSVYGSPTSQGGKLMTRGEMNAIGHLASVNEYYRRCGGINTFDPELAMKIGGYPRGAVLEIIEDLDYHKVVSLIDDNKVDFNGDTLTEQQIAAGITLGSIDGVNWAYCANGEIDTSMVVAELPNFHWLGAVNQGLVEIATLASFKAKQNGVLSFEGSFDYDTYTGGNYRDESVAVTQAGTTNETRTVTQTIESKGGSTYPGIIPSGFMILLSDNPAMSPSELKAKVVYSRGNAGITIGGITYTTDDQEVVEVVKDRRYALYILHQNIVVTNSTFKIKIVP